jgi:hypothetical protein
MAVKEKFRNPFEPSEFIGLFSDSKPTKSIQYPDSNVLPFSTFIEKDGTGKVIGFYIYDGVAWNAKNAENAIGDIESGIATNGSKTTIADTSKNIGTNIFAGTIAKIIIAGVSYLRSVASNTADTITIAALPGAVASAVINNGVNGEVTIVRETDGDVAYEVEVVVSAGNNMALSASFADGMLTVYLGTDAEGVADNAKNTGTLVAAVISDVPDFNATLTGSEGVVAVTENAIPFTGGVDAVVVGVGCEYHIKRAISAT